MSTDAQESSEVAPTPALETRPLTTYFDVIESGAAIESEGVGSDGGYGMFRFQEEGSPLPTPAPDTLFAVPPTNESESE